MKYRADIDGLRAVAVATVVAFHAGVPGIHGGYAGVDVFFVVSGFLIGGLISERQGPDHWRGMETLLSSQILPVDLD